MSRQGPWRRRAQVGFWDLERAHRPARPWPTTLLFRVRYEILLTLSALGLTVALIDLLNGATAFALICVLVGAGFSVPPLRATATLVWWHVVTPHQIRRCCIELGIYNRAGRLPVILRTRTRRDGQSVTLWCRTGTSPQDFAEALSLFRTACWAEAVRVERHPRGEPLLILRIDRRPGARLWDNGTDAAGRRPFPGDGGRAARIAIPAQRVQTSLARVSGGP